MHNRCSPICLVALAAAVALGPSQAWAGGRYPLGDLNCDGDVNAFDIDPFVLALVDPADYYAVYPDCDHMLADINQDGVVNGFDIDPFVDLLVAVVQTELAGNPLSAYPYFEYVRAFHESGPVSVAIDPTRYPIAGQTGDIYVVQAKTQAEWSSDPSLVDVRPGGAQTEAFSAGTIQDNTFTVASAHELDGDAGYGLGVGHDVVVDMNQNGTLDAGDYIDGRGDEAGLFVIHDTTEPGPLAVTEIIYSGGSWLGQDTYYPTDIASMGQLPLVVVSHGNGHYYTWYDHIGYHLASYGYIVMSHQNNTSPGSATASYTTLYNTDYIIGNQDAIGGGVLDGHLDSSRITWIGHSRGGEGVVKAHVRLRIGEVVPVYYDIDDIALVSSIAPVTHISPASASTPYDENYHMFIAAADADVTGSPGSSNSKPLAFYERSFGNKQVIYVHGAGHGDFHDGGGSSVATGPDLIGRAATHKVVKGYYLPLVQLYVDGNVAAKDFFTRMYEEFHPAGIDSYVIIASEYKDAEATGNFVIDDYQTQTSTGTSSSGGSVTYNVSNTSEVLMRDQDGSFYWTGSQPSNGMTSYRFSGDNGRCVVFDWTSPRYYEAEVIPSQRDFSDDAYLSLRACQGTRHPNTDALDSPLSFSVTLRDGSGVSSSIDFASYGRITRTYLRTGSGAGAGWANEWNTVRIRLTDFLHNGSGLDLADVAAVRFDFGSGFGSALGRIGVDDVEITMD